MFTANLMGKMSAFRLMPVHLVASSIWIPSGVNTPRSSWTYFEPVSQLEIGQRELCAVIVCAHESAGPDGSDRIGTEVDGALQYAWKRIPLLWELGIGRTVDAPVR